MNRRYAMLGVVAVLVVALLAAGCAGGSSAGGMYGSQTRATSTAKAGAATVGVGVGSTKLGNVVVNSAGRTLYLFEKDQNGQSACNGACAAYWPPLISTGAPAALTGVNQALIGTTKRSDGSEQVTYAGHPLYLYAGDQKAGDATGEGLTDFGAGWDALTPAGAKIEADAG